MNNEDFNDLPKRGRPPKKSKISVNSGRKKLDTDNVSKSTMYRRASDIASLANNNVSLLEIALRAAKRKSISSEENVDSSEEDESEYNNELNRHSNESALAFYLENDYSQKSYSNLVKDSRQRNCSIYPSYKKIAEAMVQCQTQNYTSSESECLVSLQSLLNKTSERLCEAVSLEWPKSTLKNLELMVTIGFDSSGGHGNPHQSFADTDQENVNPHQSLFISHMIVIQLKDSKNNAHSWINPTPQSIRFCRPLRIAFEKEDSEATLREYKRINKEIKDLQSHNFLMSNGNKVTVKFKVYEIMFYEKCLNAVVRNTATSRCPICLKTSHQFNNSEENFIPNISSLKHGLGLLHCEINTMGYFLKLSYRKNLQKWDVRKTERDQYNERKQLIQKNVYEKIGVKVDQVLQGHGTTNTGNVARRCFNNPEEFATALEIDPQLVSNVSTILLAFKSKMLLDLEQLHRFCIETYQKHYTLYPWARMCPSLHKLLQHGCQIAKEFLIPMIYYSEDALESWHKFYRKNLKSHSRQNSRSNRILDVFNRALYLSDPKISLILINERKKETKEDLPIQVQAFLQKNVS